MKRLAVWTLLVALISGSFGYYAGTRALFAPEQATAAGAACITFPETDKQVCDRFLEYWQQNGGLAQQGLPLSNEFQEVSAVDGKTYTVQYFERAVFEKHPENPRPYDVLLTLLGREKYQAKYPGGLPTGGAPVAAGQTVIMPALKDGVTFRVEIAGVEVRQDLPASYTGGSAAKANGKFICILARSTNLGGESSFIYSSDVKVKDQQGRQYDFAPSLAQSNAAKLFGRETYITTVQPSFSADIVIVFDVAADSTNLTFVIK